MNWSDLINIVNKFLNLLTSDFDESLIKKKDHLINNSQIIGVHDFK